jgi:hypothetical protein
VTSAATVSRRLEVELIGGQDFFLFSRIRVRTFNRQPHRRIVSSFVSPAAPVGIWMKSGSRLRSTGILERGMPVSEPRNWETNPLVKHLLGTIDGSLRFPDNMGVSEWLPKPQPSMPRPSTEENYPRHHDACMKTARVRRSSLKTCDIFQLQVGARTRAPAREPLDVATCSACRRAFRGVTRQCAPCFMRPAEAVSSNQIGMSVHTPL